MAHASLREQLDAVRSRVGLAPPAPYPVLHVDLELDGSLEESLRIARREVLKWVTPRVGRLPDHAWAFQDFEHLPGGSAAHAVRLVTDDYDYWIVRCDDPDKEVAGRTWTTEISVVGHRGAGRFALRQQVASREDRPTFVPAVPGVLQQIAKNPGLGRRGMVLSAEPRVVATTGAASDLIALIEHPQRRRPVFVVSLNESETDPTRALLDVGLLGRRCLGLAHVAVMTGPMTFLLSDRWGRQYSCFHKAVRIYRPHFDPYRQSPYDHPLFLPERIVQWSNGTFLDHLVRSAADESLQQIRYDKDLPSFSKVKQVALQRQRHDRAKAGTNDTDLLGLAEEELAAKGQEIEQLYVALAEEEERCRVARDEAAQATGQWFWMQKRIASLEAALRARGSDVDDAVEIPDSFDGLKDWADRHLAGRLIVTPRAARAAKKSFFADPALAYRALLLLANEYRTMRIEGGPERQHVFDDALNNLGLSNERSGEETRLRQEGDEFLVDWYGQKRVLDWHIKKGGNTRHRARCFRLYYFWDENKQIVVVGSLPEHLETRVT